LSPFQEYFATLLLPVASHAAAAAAADAAGRKNAVLSR